MKFSKELNLLFLSVFLLATAMGINFVTFPTILAKNGISSAQIGFAATCDILAGIITSFFLSKIAAKFGLIKTLFVSSSIYAFAIAIIYFYQSYYLWLALCIIMGSTWFIFAITRQAWLNSLLSNNKRGIGLGIFSMAISAGIAFGPIIVDILGAENYLSFLISAAFTLASFQAISKIKKNNDLKIESRRINLFEFFKNNPRCFLARFFLDFQTNFLIVFTVIFGKKIGFSPEKSGLLVSAFMASGFFDVYVGFLLKKYDPYKLINIGFIGCLILLIIISIFHNSYSILFVAYFCLGMMAALIYVSLFTTVNHDYKEEKLVAANATFQSIGAIGAVSSLLIGGYLISIFDAYGFTINIILGCSTYLTFLIFYNKKHGKKIFA
ncbi:MAG: MFS transporter [Rickettsiales bacterium]|nr:MFS transporter [Rickettsiales bacterium]